MIKRAISTFLFSISLLFGGGPSPLFAQNATVSDTVAAKQKDPMKYGKVQVNAMLVGWDSSDVLNAFLICGKDTLKESYKHTGTFYWNKVPVGVSRVVAWADGYIAESDTLLVREGKTTEKDFYITDRVIQLKTVTVKGNIPAVVYRGDTIRFNPQGVSVLEGDMALNILEQMPGVEVGEQSVKVMGKDVAKTYVDGKTIFGDNPMDALNHLPANDVVYISAYDEFEHKEQNKKNRRGQKHRVLNIETKSKLVNSKEGNLMVGVGGNLEKQQLSDHNVRYVAGGTFNIFSEKLLLDVNVAHNNLNKPTNSPIHFLNIASNLMQITYSENSYGGFNLSRKWEKETGFFKEIKGGYQFTRSATEDNSRYEQEYFATDAYRQKNYLSQGHSTTQHNKHGAKLGFNMNDKKWGELKVNYTLDSDHSRGYSLQQITNTVDEVITGSRLQQRNNGKELEMKGSMEWNKYFGEWQYTLQANYQNNSNDNGEERENELQDHNAGSLTESITIPSDKRGNKWEIETGLRRMLSKEEFAFAELSYHFLSDNRHINRMAWNKTTEEIDATNTYSYRNALTEHTPSMTFELPRMGNTHLKMKIGWQHSTINDRKRATNGYEKSFDSPIGSFQWLFKNEKKPKTGNHEIAYSLCSQLPDIMQLRSKINNVNPYFISSGNPLLKASTIHEIKWKEEYFISSHKNILLSDLTFRVIQNSIAGKNTYFSTPTYLPELNYTTIANSTLSSYDNLNGAWNIRWHISETLPLLKIKSNVNLSIDNSYEHMPYYYNNLQDVTNMKSTIFNTRFSSSLIPKTRMSVGWSIKYQQSDNKISELRNRILSNRIMASATCRPFLKYFFASVYYSYLIQNNKAYEQIDRSHLLNVYAGAPLFKKKGELSITAFDLLNSSNHMILVKENYMAYIDRENFGRYFTVNFTWKFRNIKSNRMDISRGVNW